MSIETYLEALKIKNRGGDRNQREWSKSNSHSHVKRGTLTKNGLEIAWAGLRGICGNGNVRPWSDDGDVVADAGRKAGCPCVPLTGRKSLTMQTKQVRSDSLAITLPDACLDHHLPPTSSLPLPYLLPYIRISFCTSCLLFIAQSMGNIGRPPFLDNTF